MKNKNYNFQKQDLTTPSLFLNLDSLMPNKKIKLIYFIIIALKKLIIMDFYIRDNVYFQTSLN